MSEIRSYPSIYALGHKALADLLDGPVVVEEKVDGSQFSFGVVGGALCCRSKGQQIVLDAPEGMFAAGVAAVREIADRLTPGWIYRGEYLRQPKHNTLAYERIPAHHIALYDVDTGDQHYLSPAEKAAEAARIGLELVPVLYEGVVTSVDALAGFLPAVSLLGGQPEGVVVKNYAKFGPDKKVLMGKFVTEAFRETHKVAWKESNPTTKDVVDGLIDRYRTEARWAKAVQHLREVGALTESPRDIGALLKEVPADVRKECEEEIKDALFRYAWPHIARGVTGGLPEWYKASLVPQDVAA